MNIKMSGCIVYEMTLREYKFISWLKPENFTNDLYADVCKNYILICGHTIEVDAGEVDLITPQLRNLDRQESELSAKYQAAKIQIEARRQSLLAIECEAQS